MAVIISKEDILGSATSTPVASALPSGDALAKINSVLAQIDILLKNPMIQSVLYRFMGRFGINPIPIAQNNPELKQQNIPQNEVKPQIIVKPQFTPTQIFDMIIGTIDSILNTAGDLPLSKVKEYMTQNKETLISMIGKSLEGDNANKPTI